MGGREVPHLRIGHPGDERAQLVHELAALGQRRRRPQRAEARHEHLRERGVVERAGDREGLLDERTATLQRGDEHQLGAEQRQQAGPPALGLGAQVERRLDGGDELDVRGAERRRERPVHGHHGPSAADTVADALREVRRREELVPGTGLAGLAPGLADVGEEVAAQLVLVGAEVVEELEGRLEPPEGLVGSEGGQRVLAGAAGVVDHLERSSPGGEQVPCDRADALTEVGAVELLDRHRHAAVQLGATDGAQIVREGLRDQRVDEPQPSRAGAALGEQRRRHRDVDRVDDLVHRLVEHRGQEVELEVTTDDRRRAEDPLRIVGRGGGPAASPRRGRWRARTAGRPSSSGPMAVGVRGRGGPLSSRSRSTSATNNGLPSVSRCRRPANATASSVGSCAADASEQLHDVVARRAPAGPPARPGPPAEGRPARR